MHKRINWAKVMKFARGSTSQLVFAERVRMTASHLGKIEKGTAIPQTAELIRISQEIDVGLPKLIAQGED